MSNKRQDPLTKTKEILFHHLHILHVTTVSVFLSSPIFCIVFFKLASWRDLLINCRTVTLCTVSHEQTLRVVSNWSWSPDCFRFASVVIQFDILIWGWMSWTFTDICSTAVEFSCACAQPPVLFDAFMFHLGGINLVLMDWQGLNTANKPRKELIGQCIKTVQKKNRIDSRDYQWVCEL